MDITPPSSNKNINQKGLNIWIIGKTYAILLLENK